MASDTDHRMSLRFAADDLDWIAEQAADEGVDNATMVRMIVNRLRRGRAPLISMMEAPRSEPRMTVQQYGEKLLRDTYNDELSDRSAADEVLEARLAEVEQGGAEVISFQPDVEAAAMPIRRVERERYNPGRK